MAIPSAPATLKKPTAIDQKPQAIKISSSVPATKQRCKRPQVTVEMCPPPSLPAPRPRSPVKPLTRCQVLRARYRSRPEDVGEAISLTCQLSRMKPTDFHSPYAYFVEFEKLMTRQDRMGFAMEDVNKAALLLRAITSLVRAEGRYLTRLVAKGKLDYMQLLAQMKKKYNPSGRRMAVPSRAQKPQSQVLRLSPPYQRRPAI